MKQKFGTDDILSKIEPIFAYLEAAATKKCETINNRVMDQTKF